MRNILLSTAALAMLTTSAFAQSAVVTTTEPTSEAEQATGTLAGTGTGAVAGALVGGPVGAIVGGFIGTAIGATASAPDDVRQYVISNPVDPVTVEGEITEGMVVPASVELVPVPDNDEYAYIYADGGRPVIVRSSDRSVVYSPAGVSETAVSYVRANPIDEVAVEGELVVGQPVPSSVVLQPLPEEAGYSYFYSNGRPYIVSDSNREIIYYAD